MCASSDDAEKRCKITAFHRNDQMSRTFSRRDCVRFRPWAASRGDVRRQRCAGKPFLRAAFAVVSPARLHGGFRVADGPLAPFVARRTAAREGMGGDCRRRGPPDCLASRTACGSPHAGLRGTPGRKPGRRDEAREPRGIVAGCVSGLPGDEAAPARPRHCPGRGFMMDVRPRPRRLPLLRRRTCGTAPASRKARAA